MVGHHAVSRIHPVVEPPRVGWGLGEILNGGEKSSEKIDIVVALLALQHRGHPLETHAGVDMAGGQRDQTAIGITIELDKHQVPDFDATISPPVHQGTTAFVRSEIDMDLGAGPARTGVAHLPEVVFFVAQVDMTFGDGGGPGP